MITIEIPTLGEGTLGDVLESIRNQTLQEYEVIIVDSSTGHYAKDIASSYDARIVSKKVGLLRAREIAHSFARGERALLLDATRILAKDCLERLSGMREDMVIIAERESGHGFFRKAIDMDKCLTLSMVKGIDEALPLALPRYFDSSLLSLAFSRIDSRIGIASEKIVAEDHRIIFFEAKRISSSLGIIRYPLIYHFSDCGFQAIFHKFFRYGRSARFALQHYPEVGRKARRSMKNLALSERAELLLLYLWQSIAYYSGYIISEAGQV